jgi:hypothetical protein
MPAMATSRMSWLQSLPALHPHTTSSPSSSPNNRQEQHSPSPKSAHRLPNRRDNSVLPQRRARLEAAGDGGSPGRDRTEDAGCHRGGFIGSARSFWVGFGWAGVVVWCGTSDVVWSSPHPSKLETLALDPGRLCKLATLGAEHSMRRRVCFAGWII